MEHLEKVVGEVGMVVEGECRNLLAQAGKLIFTNLCLLRNSGALNQAGLCLGAVLERVQADGEEVTKALKEEVDHLVGTLCDSFTRADGADEGGGPSGGAGGGTSGGGTDGEARDAPAE